MKVLPVGKQNFADIIRRDMLYVDKTKQVYRLVELGDLYFLARPRRFGKSLLISTFYHLFSGERELFEDLYIGKETDYDFPTYPILQFNFARYGHKTTSLEERISQDILRHAEQYNIKLTTKVVSDQFIELVEKIAKRDKPVVILIDEYDKPIVDFLKDTKQAKANQKTLRDFFSPLKSFEAQGHLRFLFVTGVSKFSKVSLFSDLNNLKDLSTEYLADELLGITHQELLDSFQPHIEYAAQRMRMTKEYLLEGVKLWYNGYSFDGDTKLYNPFSLLNFFTSYRFAGFWFATGTPTFLVETIRDEKVDPKELEKILVPSTFFDKFSLEHLDMYGLLYQTGYLTIKRVERSGFSEYFYLGYPNEEVRRAFTHNLLESFTYKTDSIVGQALVRMEQGLRAGDVATFIKQLKILLSDISYFNLPPLPKSSNANKKEENFAMWEGYFHTIIYLIMVFIRFQVKSEIAKHKGRLDLIAETDDYLYLMEFKLDEPAENAIEQIKQREYATAYTNTTKKLVLVGVGFSRKERNVKEWKMEIWQPKNE